ncbi:hypothetical protein ACSX1A_03720 [Pontibacter sp. MBLB2868]|uniref:hypothetical protein n=1 Tax=Pontibacter sp. MBLB2868 TaxID=3451555 RepID=UPI003F753AA9
MNITESAHQFAIKYNEALCLLEVVWYGCMSEERLQKAHDNISEVLTTKQVKLFVSDISLSTTNRVKEELWLMNYCFPLLENIGILRIARIANPDALGHMVVSNLIEVVNREEQYDFRIETFSARDRALDWLLTA